MIKSNINFYADDTIIYGSDSWLLQSDLETTHTWCNMNMLTVNCKKSQWMNINLSTNKLTDVVFILGNTKLEKVNEFKYLGVTIESLINRVIFFRKIQMFMTLKSAMMVYKGTILPILEYCTKSLSTISYNKHWNKMLLYTTHKRRGDRL